MSDTDLPDDDAISDDDWAAAMQEQADAEDGGLGADEAAALMDTASAHFSADEFEPKYDPKPDPKPAGSQLFPDFGHGGGKSGAINDYDMILDIPVQITVELGRTKIAIRNLLQLAHGSVVELDGLAGEPMDVLVNGTLIAQGEVVVVNDKFGIRLTDIITPAERMRKLRN